MKVTVLLLTAYCIPFAFLGVLGDVIFNTIMFYCIMIAGFSLLLYIALQSRNTAIVFIGNGLSFISSYTFAKLFTEPTGHYFKPFTFHSLIIVISVVAIIIQSIFIYAKKIHK